MATKSARVIPILADMGDSKVLVDRIEGGSPFIWRGETVQIRVLCALNGAELDLANIASLVCEVKPYADRDGAAVMSKTVLAAAIDPDATLVQFDAASHQHATFEFSKTETNLTLTEDRVNYWMVIHGFTTDNPSKEITYAAGVITVEEDGAVSGQAAPAIAPLVVIDDGDSPYSAPDTVSTILVDTSGGAVAIELPANPLDGQRVTIKDATGDAATNAITITDPNSKTIDGQASYVIGDNLAGIEVTWSTTLDGWFLI